ncbi:MAG TPA: patatin-like phospholipase family protein [Usitatibacteraceae bacterium]|nr:patatin-like phospholipase family protein [Usitatibacteraceae bacterium]
MKPARLCLAFACIAGAVAAPAESLAQAGAPVRPKVGLVLGGGGARGGAHLGVLEVLEEMRIPFDCVAGTSIGALVGGAYVAGVSPAEMRETIRRTDWNTLFDDSAGRDAVGLRRKYLDDRFYSGLEFGVTTRGLRYREGAVAGEKFKLFFNQLVRTDPGDRNIEELPLPLTLIATDIGTGERVALREGSLAGAMRASMSVPGVIAPVIREGHMLVDGGLVDNLPIQEVRERCGAEVVIAVNVGSPLLKPEEVTGVVSVVGQVVNLLTEQNVAKSLSLLKPGDIYLKPDLGDVTAADFTRQLDAAEAGRKAALGAAEALRTLSVAPAAYREWRARVRLAPTQAPVIDEIRVAATRFVNPRDLRESIRQREGQPLDAKALAEDLVLIYSRGDLRNLDYSILRERDKTVLKLTPIEKPWGPDYLRFGVNLSSDFRTDSPYNLRALYRKTWINAQGAEWLAAVQLGSDQLISTEFYQPVDERQRWFVRPFASVGLTKVGLFLDGDRLAEYRLRIARAGLDAGANLGAYGQASLGWLERNLRATLDTGPPILPEVKMDFGGPTAAVAIDTQDFAFFPTRGYRANVNVFDAQRVSTGLGKYGRAEAKFGGAWSLGDLIVLGSLEGGKTLHGTLPLGDTFSLGGQRRLSAFAPDQILGGEYGLGTMQVQWRLTRPLPIFGLSLLAGVSYETGRMRDPITESNLTGRLDSYGLYLAANTPLGPMYLGYADTSGRSGRFYLFIGTP